MKRLVILLALVFCASAAMAVPNLAAYDWNLEYDFSDGLQGWTSVSGAGYWVNPATDPYGPMLPDNDVSGAGGGNVYTPDASRFFMDLSALQLKGRTGRGIAVTAKLYVPNLRPLSGFTWGYPGNALKSAGIQINQSGGKVAYIEGDNDHGGWVAKDTAWDNSSRRTTEWILEETTSPDALWWDDWVTVLYDYGYTTTDRWTAWVQVPWDTPMGDAGWYQCGTTDYQTSDRDILGVSIGGSSSWTQTQIDDVKIAYLIPEPGSLLALGTGLLGLVGMIRRRK